MTRNAARGGDLATMLDGVIPVLHRAMAEHLTTGWTVVDSSALTVQETVDEILSRTVSALQ